MRGCLWHCVVVAGAVSAAAMQNANANEAKVWFGPGMATLEAREIVYVPEDNYKLSELVWTSDPIYTLNAGFEFQLMPKTRLRVSGVFGFAGDSRMVDYDWLDQSRADWTNRSIHDVVELPAYVEMDLRVAQQLARREQFDFSMLGGLHYQKVKWNSFGGQFVYSTFDEDGNLIGFRDDIFSAPDSERAISYRQEWLTPYLGFEAGWRKGPASLVFTVTGSPFSFAWDVDDHWQRSLQFLEAFEPSALATADLQLGYEFHPRMQLSLSGGVAAHFKALGRAKIVDTTGVSPVQTGPHGGAGATLINYHAAIGIEFKL